MNPAHALLVTCEHARHDIPRRYGWLFRTRAARRALKSHRGFDLGALSVARALSRNPSCQLLVARWSRLLVELNRSENHLRLFSEFSRKLPTSEREHVLAHYYRPHRRAVEDELSSMLQVRRVAVHVASHTFTPILGGETRRADVAFLYDPKRPAELRLVRRWQELLKRLRPDLRVRRNYPYRGSSDGLTTALRRRFAPRRYVGIELEVNQLWFGAPRSRQSALRRAISDSLSETLRTLR